MKYLIEVPDETGQAYYNIAPYTEPNNKDNAMWMDGYEKGVKAGRDNAWEFARKVECMGIGEIEEAFDIHKENAMYPFNQMSYQEAKAKYEAWKESKEEIHVGDEIRIKTSYSADAVVIGMDDYDLFIVWKDGETDRIEPPERKQWVKTGKHFPEVEELLKKITEESNED